VFIFGELFYEGTKIARLSKEKRLNQYQKRMRKNKARKNV
jgi:hypothetical protein